MEVPFTSTFNRGKPAINRIQAMAALRELF